MMTTREALDYARRRFGPRAMFVEEQHQQDGKLLTWIHVGVPGLHGWLKSYGCGRTHEEALRDADLHYEHQKRALPKPKYGDALPPKFHRTEPSLPAPGPSTYQPITTRSIEEFYGSNSSLGAPTVKRSVEDLVF